MDLFKETLSIQMKNSLEAQRLQPDPIYFDGSDFIFEFIEGEKHKIDSSLSHFVAVAVSLGYEKEFTLFQSYFENHCLVSTISFESLIEYKTTSE